MRVLAVNAGSTSVKLSLLDDERTQGECKLGGESDPPGRLREFTAGFPAEAVVHRVVHGGDRFSGPTIIDRETRAAIDRLARLAPLHNPIALRWITACIELFPNLPQVAVFDTGFFAGLPPRAARYAIPTELATRLSIRRYGFHGIAHQAMNERWQALRPDLVGGGRLITLQLGGGSSITASERGYPIDTSMGFSPLEGLVMATRSGDIDPGLFAYIAREEGLGAEEVEQLLYRRSGLLGLSGKRDMAELLRSDTAEDRAAVELYAYRIRKYIGAYIAALAGIDGIVFGGGIGENAPAVRALSLAGLAWCGVRLDAGSNDGTMGTEGRISAADSAVDIRVLPVDEAGVMARQASALLAGTDHPTPGQYG